MYEQRRSAKINLDRKSVLVWLHSAKLSLELNKKPLLISVSIETTLLNYRMWLTEI